jgi:hypothetical protein
MIEPSEYMLLFAEYKSGKEALEKSIREAQKAFYALPLVKKYQEAYKDMELALEPLISSSIVSIEYDPEVEVYKVSANMWSNAREEWEEELTEFLVRKGAFLFSTDEVRRHDGALERDYQQVVSTVRKGAVALREMTSAWKVLQETVKGVPPEVAESLKTLEDQLESLRVQQQVSREKVDAGLWIRKINKEND